MEPTDKQLLLACRRGDESAWEVLVNRYQRLMYAIPRRAGLDDDQAEIFDADYSGYDFWLTKLNQFNGNFVNADMVKSFLIAGEYRHRFAP